MKKKAWFACCSLLLLLCIAAGCGRTADRQASQSAESSDSFIAEQEQNDDVLLTSQIIRLEDGFFAVRYDGDDGFDAFLSQGGAASDSEVVDYLANNMLSGLNVGDLLGDIFGCSTLSVQSPEGDRLFGRNFDWENCEAMVVAAYPKNGYASLSTVDMDFISQGAGGGAVGLALQMDEVKTLAALYAPLDGVNEAGLVVSVNMIQDSAAIAQDTDKPDITTTTAIRLLLNQAANVEEALELLRQYDLHASMGMMIHFALADSTGRSVAVEYVNNEMVVIETPVLTNFYLAEGEKQGIGTQQSHERYNILMRRLNASETMDMQNVRDALDSVSKDNFGEFESTEWSAVFNQSTGEARYYHRENYQKSYTFRLK